MTFTVRIRTLPGAPLLAEYLCPVHGRFELLVERDANGDPPAWVWCERGCDEDPHGCEWDDPTIKEPYCERDCAAKGGRQAEHVLSTFSSNAHSWDPVPIGRASKHDEHDPRALDTRPLAEGKMTKAEWKKWQRGITLERRHQKRLKSGRISKRIQVGGG